MPPASSRPASADLTGQLLQVEQNSAKCRDEHQLQNIVSTLDEKKQKEFKLVKKVKGWDASSALEWLKTNNLHLPEKKADLEKAVHKAFKKIVQKTAEAKQNKK